MATFGRVLVVGLGLMLAGCSGGSTARVASSTRSVVTSSVPRPDSSSVARSASTTVASDSGTGPVANVDHWHAAYGVYDCDRYLDPIDASELPDPDGIHTHADGLIHIHPFTERASGAKATLAVFLESVGLVVTPNRMALAMPGITPFDRKNGDLCPSGKPGRVRVIRFSGPTHSDPVEVEDPTLLRFERDMVLAIVFAPDDQLIGPPPSMSELDRPADLPIEFELTPERQALVGNEPTVVLPEKKPSALQITDIEVGTGEAVGESSKVGVKFVLATWSAGKAVESNWQDSAPLLGLALGRNSVVKGFDEGMQGMRVGGLRRIVIPPEFGFGTLGSPPLIGPNETLVLYVRLVAIESPRFAVTGTTLPS